MAFDKETRNALAKAVTACRRLLMADVTDQLRGTFGMHPDGTVLPLKDLRHLTDDQKEAAQALRDLLDHYAAAAAGTATEKRKSAYERMVLEIAFTNLNRLAALRMCEERGLVLECVRKGAASDGFRMYEQLSGGALGTRFETYRLFLASLYDELAIDLGILFDRTTPQSAVFPTERCLEEVLAELNKAELAQLWKEDETIGWVYQYFNPPEERREMRDASQAPRNSRELAVRNQFFTPRYVVEFLTDNTLGRIWYEMRQGVTGLKEQCRYLVRRPDEVFLGHMTVPGPDGYEDEGTIAAAKLLLEGTQETFADFDASRDGDIQRMICMSHAVNGYARHEAGTWEGLEPLAAKMRAGELKDLSTQDILDYLFLTCRADRHGGMGEVYSERWFVTACNEVRRRVLNSHNENLPQEELLKQPVVIPYRAKKDPRDLKILDPACGSGHFLLYCFDLLLLIYAEAWEDSESPTSEATGKTLREDYATLGELCRAVPGSILRWNLHGIDIDPRAVQIAALALWLRAQRAWQEQHVKAADRPQVTKSNIVIAEPMPGEEDMRREFSESLRPRVLGQLVDAIFDKMKLAGEAGSLLRIEEEIREAVADAKAQWLESPQSEQQFLFPELAKPRQLELRFDLAGVTDAAFWDHAEEQIIDALRAYAERVRHGDTLRKQLFAEDAARGFAFIDICRTHYDVAVMNPPFGAFPLAADALLNESFPSCRGDFYPSFIERWNASATYLGAITNRTGLSLGGLEEWRKANLLGGKSLVLLADLGMNVLDALVEAAIYVVAESHHGPLIAFDSLDTPADKKEKQIYDGVSLIKQAVWPQFMFIKQLSSFSRLPTTPICYKAPHSILNAFTSLRQAERNGLVFRVTSPNYDDFRYLRLKWEVPPRHIGRQLRWSPIAKGGEYAPYYADIDLLIDWHEEAGSFRGYLGTVHRPLVRPACADLFFLGGITWSERTASRFSPRVLPENTIFSSVGPYCGGRSRDEMLTVLGVMMSAPFQGMLELFLAAGDATSSGSAARHYQVGALRCLPFPDVSLPQQQEIRSHVRALIHIQQQHAACEESTSLFEAAFRPPSQGESLTEIINERCREVERGIERSLRATERLDRLVGDQYGLDDAGWDYLRRIFGAHPLQYSEDKEAVSLARDLMAMPVDKLIQSSVGSGSAGRFITVKSFYADRQLEVLSHYLQVRALALLPDYVNLCIKPEVTCRIALASASYFVGCAFGRWDIRYTTGARAAPELPDPFAPLPVCSPGQLQNAQGLPACPEDVPAAYPVHIPWNGILVDDPNHPLDIERRVREVIEIIWSGSAGGSTAEAIEHEACEVLGVKSLRDYLRKPAAFFADHLKRYSKSRRQAPIYWPLSTASGIYTLWLYYHRLTDQTLYTAVNKYVEPKIDETRRAIGQLEHEQGKSGGREGVRQRDRLDEARTLLSELEDMREELLRIAGLPYKPNLNDGVIINAAPLHKLFRHRQWAKDAADCWKSLEKGEYDWAHMAYTIWPERVKKVCKKDLSIAIAHGLEDLYEGPKPGEKKERKPRGKKAKKEAAE